VINLSGRLALPLLITENEMYRKLAAHLREGEKVCFDTYSFIVDDVEFTRHGEVKVNHGNYTAVDWFQMDEFVFVENNHEL